MIFFTDVVSESKEGIKHRTYLTLQVSTELICAIEIFEQVGKSPCSFPIESITPKTVSTNRQHVIFIGHKGKNKRVGGACTDG